MPPRFVYWTILIDGKPTAFRARDREELLTTFGQLKRKNDDVVIRWFARGRLWESPEAERAAERPPTFAGEKRGKEWRPGGAHKDPRDRFKKKNRPERAWSENDETARRDREKLGPPKSSRPWHDKPAGPPRGAPLDSSKPFGGRKPFGSGPPDSRKPFGDRKPFSSRPLDSSKPFGGRQPSSGGKPPGGGKPYEGVKPHSDRHNDRPWQTKPSGPRADRRPWSGKPSGPPRDDRKPWTGKPSGPPGDRKPWTGKPSGPPRDRKPWTGKPSGPPGSDRPWSGKPSTGAAASGRPWSGKPRDPNRKPFVPRAKPPYRKRRDDDPEKS